MRVEIKRQVGGDSLFSDLISYRDNRDQETVPF